MSDALTLKLPDEAATLALGQRLSTVVGPGLICLSGDLGAGKTCLVRGLLRGLGYQGRVKSPTYTLVEPYQSDELAVSHWDLYRLSAPEEMEALGFREHQQDQELILVEWPDRAPELLSRPDLTVALGYQGEGRQVKLTAGSMRGEGWLQALRHAEEESNP